MFYTCDRCNQEFKLNEHYQKHLHRVNPCKNSNIKNSNININMKKLYNKILTKFSKGLREKMNNIVKAQEGSICGNRRCSTSCRTLISYKDVIKNNLSLEDLKLWKNDITVNLINGDYMDLHEKGNKTELEEHLFNNVGGNGTVSSIISITKIGGSSSGSELKPIRDRLQPIFDDKGWIPICRNEDIPHGETAIYNKHWSGEYHVNICGGSNKTKEQTHPEKIRKNQIFINFEGSMDDSVGVHCKLHLLYTMLFAEDILDHTEFKDQDELHNTQKQLREKLEKINYDDGNVLNWSDKYIMDGS
jgi:hypothetical protein